jgi:hypothetical protein
MNLDGLRRAIEREPFRPFQIRLADGRSLDVRHPEFVSVGARLVTVRMDDDALSIVEPLLIVSLDYSPPRRSGNGAPRTRRR